ncbi:hypothetical protein [Actinoplanes aureus]|uniref:Uncharacterized protein n=1 Tax=Actinoplanes aureus TaxID=2792083 RepID=A0A931FUZ6_9ACTN|nr:hypothetical protein [Actinoplanes aureus]MBG0560773.1 hypothetical protein [Actinoplanes aureus]
MTAARAERGGNTLLAVTVAVVAIADGVLVWLGWTAWQAYRDGGFTIAQAAPFAVMGVSAVAGVALAMLAVITLMRGRRSHGLAGTAVTLARLRLGAVIVALAVVVFVSGLGAMAAVLPIFGIVLAVGDAFGGIVVTGAATRRTQDG